MKRIAVILLALLGAATGGAQTADAPPISDYAWGFPIQVGGGESFYNVELPLQVYGSVTDPELRDAGVYNGDGRPVPRQFVPVNIDVALTERIEALPMLPLFATGAADEAQVSLKRNGNDIQFRFDLDDIAALAAGQRLAAYIVDARQIDDRADALDLVWAEQAPGFMGTVTIDSGSDLQTWQPSGTAVIADLREEQASIVQRRVRLSRGGDAYLRIRWEGMPEGWRLQQVLGVYREGGVEPARNTTRLQSTATDPDDGGRIFELGGAPMVDRVQVILPVPNTVIAARVSYWSESGDRWLDAGQGSFHHIVRDNQSVTSSPVSIGPVRTGRFKVTMTKGPPDVALQLDIGWRPDALLFLAQGQAPYTLATGNAADAADRFPQQRIYGDQSLRQLATRNGGLSNATLGPRYVLGGPDRLRIVEPTDWRQPALWLALLLGVGFVSFMAVKTVRELKKPGE